MDGNQFDQFAKSLAGTSRRSLLKGAIAVVLGGAFGTALPGAMISETAAASRRTVGQICRKNSDCASGNCGPRDFAGRRRCDCSTGSDCPTHGACSTPTCSNGICGSTPATGGSCDDRNPCTINTTCQSGICAGTNVADGTNCGGSRVCVSGVCSTGCSINSVLYSAGASDPANPCQSCQPSISTSSWSAKSNGATCSSGDLCLTGETCQSGVCGGGSQVVCTALDQCHAAGICDSQTGFCSNPEQPDGTSCDDGNACTQTDTCQAGMCTGGNPVVCTPLDSCHSAGVCDPSSGVCSNPVKANGTSCNDQNLCSQTDTCQDGVCTGENPVVCAAPDQCHQQGVCNQGTGLCEYEPVADGTGCDDGNACTQTDTCQAGVCTGGNPVVCSALDQCHTAGTCNPANGTCSNPEKSDGTSCSDGNSSTCNDTCQAGVCTGTAVNLQTDSNNCGSCGNVCSSDHATSICVAGVCAIGSCNAGFANCNNIATDGCETNTNTDSNNCGACNSICSLGQRCSSGICTGCFVAGTRIAMADGTSRPIELVAVGDLVIGENGEINQVEEVMLPLLGERKLYAFNGGGHFVTGSHPFMTDEGWKSIDPVLSEAEHPGISTGAIKIGDRLHAMTGVAVAAGNVGVRRNDRADLRTDASVVERIESKGADPSTQLYNLRLDGNHTYFANDLLVHNKV